MRLNNETPLAAERLAWRRASGPKSITVVCKATYVLDQGESRLAPPEDQEGVRDADVFDGDESRGPLQLASDFVPFKEGVDVVVVGAAFSHRPAPSLLTILRVGEPEGAEIHKTIQIVGDRYRRADGGLTAPATFSEMPLTWDRSAGGPHTANPAGVVTGQAVHSHAKLPNFFPDGKQHPKPGDVVEPVGFGPISPTWPSRAGFARRYGPHWDPYGWMGGSIPDDLPPAFFNVAPAHQTLRQFRFSLPVFLQGLHRRFPFVSTNLARVLPQALIDTGERSTKRSVPLVCDTLWIDTLAGTCVVSWRGFIEDAEDDGVIHLFHVDPLPFGRLKAERPNIQVPTDPSATVYAPPKDEPQSRPARSVKIKEQQAPSYEPTILDPGEVTLPPTGMVRAAIPFEGTSAFPPNYVPSPPPSAPVGAPPVSFQGGAPSSSRDVTSPASQQLAAHPHRVPGVITEPPPRMSMDLPSVPATVARPILVAPGHHASPEGVAGFSNAAAEASPWTGGAAALAAPGEPAPTSTPALKVDDEFYQKARRAGFSPAGADSDNGLKEASPLKMSGSVVDFSNRAADRPHGMRLIPIRSEPLPPVTGVAIAAVWIDAGAHTRAKQHLPWRDLMGRLQPRLDDLPSETPKDKRTEVRQLREVLALLGRVDPAEPAELEATMANAVTDDGTFLPPLVVASGYLELPFDELETLKATLAAVAPFVPGDDELRAVVETVDKLLQTPWVNAQGEGASAQTKRIRDMFHRRSRADVPSLEAITTKILLQKRAYQKRTVWGAPKLRALLHPTGSVERSPNPAPLYLPASVGDELPAFAGFAARILAEVLLSVDQEERHPTALRPFALGRLVQGPRQGR